MIDVNVNLSRWLFRRLPGDDTAALVEKLAGSGISQAWCGTFDGLLHKDLSSANARLAAECRDFSKTHEEGDSPTEPNSAAGCTLTPFGSINPTLPDWEEDLWRCHEEHHMPGIRLHPNYHGYALDRPEFARLLDLASERELIVQLAVKMEDERTQHPLLQVAATDTGPLADLVKTRPQLKLVILNGLRDLRGAALSTLASTGNVSFEISMLEGVGGIEKILSQVPLNRLLFGSHFPLFYLESALLKLQESELGAFQIQQLTSTNAHNLLTSPQDSTSE